MRLIILLSLSFISLFAKESYGIEQAMVSYNIEGGGALSSETNMTLKGSSKLYFKQWGLELVNEDDARVTLKGALNGSVALRYYEKEEQGTLYTINYDTFKLQKRVKTDAIVLKETSIEGLTKVGEENILGYTCDVWQGKGVKKCLYKGIPLSIVSEAMGIRYTKIANKLVLAPTFNKRTFDLPNYPLENFAVVSTGFKNEAKAPTPCLSHFVQSMADQEVQKKSSYKVSKHLYAQDRAKFLNHLTQKIFTRQKRVLTKLSSILKEARICLSTASTLFSANECVVAYSNIKTI